MNRMEYTTKEKQIDNLIEEITESCFEFLLSDAQGQYIPKIFADNMLDDEVWAGKYNIDEIRNDLEQCQKGPDGSESYWDCWVSITDRFDMDGKFLHQNGDLWLIDNKKMTEILDRAENEDPEIDLDQIRDRIFCW